VLAGFGSPALITLMGLFVLAQELLHSGALARLRELLASPRIRTPPQLIPNTPIVAILLPLSFATIIGGTLTLIGTSTNLLVFGPGRYRFLDLLRYGLPLSLLYAPTVPALVLGFW
jgi:di/tricarboxylate transporter